VTDDRLDDGAAHAPLGPSGADRWSTCADSVNAQEGLPDNPTLPAAEGTVAHDISNLCLTLGFDAADFVGTTTRILDWTFTWTEEDAFLLQHGIDRTRAWPGPFFGEYRVDISPWTIPGQFGTLDRASFDDDVIRVTDLKYGRFPVYPVDNLQIILYGLGFWNDIARHHTKATKFELEIDQPRHAGGGGIWSTDLETLLRAGEWLRKRAEATLQPNPPRTASEKGCAFCRAALQKNGGCRTYEAFNTEMIGAQFDDLPVLTALTPDVIITPERRSFLLAHRKMVENWFDRLEEQELADYLAGLPTPGRKGVDDSQKGPRDKWTDEAKAEAALSERFGDQIFTKKLKTPKQAASLMDKKTFDEVVGPHVTWGHAGKSMVPLADRRPPIAVVLPDQFDDLET
jgi:hypothetical protein